MVTVKELLSSQYPSGDHHQVAFLNGGYWDWIFFKTIIKDMDKGWSAENLLRGPLTRWQGGSVQTSWSLTKTNAFCTCLKEISNMDAVGWWIHWEQTCGEGLWGISGYWTEYELAVWTHSPENEQYPLALHQKQCGKGLREVFTFYSTLVRPYLEHCAKLWNPQYKKDMELLEQAWRKVKMIERVWITSHIWRGWESWDVHLGKEKGPRTPYSSLPEAKDGLQASWRGTFHNGIG